VDWSGTKLEPYSQYRQLTARLLVEQAFRGIKGSEVVFRMDDCPYVFKQGERYLVYAHKDSAGQLSQRLGFSRTRPLSEAEEDLEFIRGLATAQPGSKIYGKVARATHNIKQVRYDHEPLRGVRVSLESKDQNYEAFTDGEGRYQFAGLSAGAYRVRAELPDRLSSKELSIQVNGVGCVPLDIFSQREGEIAGRVVDVDGQPVAGVPVSLVSADASVAEILTDIKDRGAWTLTYTNEEGRFRFTQLAPGGYLLILNRSQYEKARGSEKAQTLPRLFFPGVTGREQAEVIDVREGGKTREYVFHLLIR
jgi:hypothetical protein